MSAPEKGVRKRIADLTVDDLTSIPIWEFGLDEEGQPGQDEETIRPLFSPLQNALENSQLLIVKTEFVAANGAKYLGYQYLSDDSNISHVQPTIVTNKGHVAFWWGMVGPTASDLDRAYRLLNADRSSLFPVRYQSVDGPIKSGEVLSFMYLENDKVRAVS